MGVECDVHHLVLHQQIHLEVQIDIFLGFLLVLIKLGRFAGEAFVIVISLELFQLGEVDQFII